MSTQNRILSILTAIFAALVLVACSPETSIEDTVIEESDITDTTEIDGAGSPEITDADEAQMDTTVVEAIGDSPVNLIIESAVTTAMQDGASNGTLVLVIQLENPSNETMSLDLEVEDYIITDDAGTDIVPSTVADDLINPELEAGETVSGEIDYAVTDPASNFIFNVTGFNSAEIDALAEN